MSRTPNPAKVLLREKIASSIAALSADEKKRQSDIVYKKVCMYYCYLRVQGF